MSFLATPFNVYAGNITPSSVGPTSIEEAKLLFNQGRAHFGKGLYSTAKNHFERFVDRYPGFQGYLDAHLYLGLAYVRLGQFSSAIRPLKYFIEASTKNSESYRARVSLSRALLKLERFQQSLLTSEEILSGQTQFHNVPWEIYHEALLLKSRSQVGLNQDDRAARSLSAFHSEGKAVKRTNRLLADSHNLAIELKMRGCARILKKGLADEGHVRQMLKKKGTCLLESLIAYKDSLFTNETNWLNHSRTTITLGFKQFDRDCKNPPNPPGKRTKTELKRYREELADLLSQDCQNIQARARGMLQSWAEDKATPNPVHLEKLAQDIESAT